MNNIVKYNDFIAEIKYSVEDKIFFGTVINTKDSITFEIENIDDVMEVFQKVIEDYLEICEEVNKDTSKINFSKYLLKYLLINKKMWFIILLPLFCGSFLYFKENSVGYHNLMVFLLFSISGIIVILISIYDNYNIYKNK